MTTLTLPADEPARRRWLPLAAILALGMALRLALLGFSWSQAHDLSYVHAPDTETYLAPAESLVRDGAFAQLGHPMLVRTPGYPAFLTLGVVAGHVELVTVGLQMLLAAGSIWLVYRLALALDAGRVGALAAAAVLAVEPLSCTYTSMLLTETLFGFLLLGALSALVEYLRSGSVRWLLVTGVVLSAATFVRPITYYLPLGIAALLVARELWTLRWLGLRAAGHTALFLAVCGLPVVAWQARNRSVAGYPGFAAIADWNLFYFQGLSLVAQEEHKTLLDKQIEYGLLDIERLYSHYPELRGSSQAERYRAMHAEGQRLVRTHAWEYAKLHLRGCVALMLNPAATDACTLLGLYDSAAPRPRPMDVGMLAALGNMHRDAPGVFYLNLCLAALLGAMYALAAVGLAVRLLRPGWPLLLILATAGYLLAVSGGPACVARLRHPIMPLVAVIGGIGCAWLLQHVQLRWPAGRTELARRALVDATPWRAAA